MEFLEEGYQKEEEKNERAGIWVTFTLHALLLLLFFAPFFKTIVASDSFQGILVNFGAPEDGGDAAIAEAVLTKDLTEAIDAEDDAPTKSEPKEPSAPEPVKQETKPIKIAVKEVVKESTPVVSNTKVDESPVVAQDDNKEAEEIANKAKAAAEKAAAEKQAAEEKAAAEKAAKEKAAKEAAEAASRAAEEAKYEASKKEFNDLFSKGKGNGSNTGDTGNTDGDPDASKLDGLTTGFGEIGEGLDNRNLIYEPEITDDSQRSGIVVVKICIDASGKVIEAKYTQAGSTTTDAHLIKVAERGAKEYVFTSSKAEKQCGSVALNFTLK